MADVGWRWVWVRLVCKSAFCSLSAPLRFGPVDTEFCFYVLVPAGMGGAVVVVVAVVKVDGLFLCLCLPRAARPADLLVLPVVEVVLVVPSSSSIQVACCPPAILRNSSVEGLWAAL